MTQLEDRIARALRNEPTRPSVDLYDRVVDSIEADRRRRRHAWTAAAVVSALGVASTVAVLTLTPRRNGALAMPWWILELVTTLVLVAIAVWLGPFIKRFGRAYAADVFHDNPLTGKSYIVLTDIVYYLIFTAYILFGVHFGPQSDWRNDVTGLVTAEQLTFSAARIGGILLIIGILHGLNIVLERDGIRVRIGGRIDRVDAVELDGEVVQRADPHIGLLHRRQPVCNHQRGTVLHQAFQRHLHQALAFSIQRTGRLVQQQDGRKIGRAHV